MCLDQVIVEHSGKPCDYKTFVHGPCKSISNVQNTTRNSIEFFLNIHLG